MLLSGVMRVVALRCSRILLRSRPSKHTCVSFSEKHHAGPSTVIMQQSMACNRTWGTHFAGTKEPASMCVTPVLASRLMSSILVCSGMDFFSFCRPSRGPTSTMRAWSAPYGFDVLKLLKS